MKLTEEELVKLDEQMPELARQAVAEAYARALASGRPVTVAIGEELIEITSDGQRHVVGKVSPATRSHLAKIGI